MKTLLFLIIPILLLSLAGSHSTQTKQFSYQNPSDTTIANIKIYFENGSVRVNKKYRQNRNELKKLVKYLKEYPDSKIVVIGSSKTSGSIRINNMFAYLRAKNTIDWLVQSHQLNANCFILQYKSYIVPLCAGSPFREFQTVTFKISDGTEKNMPNPRED